MLRYPPLRSLVLNVSLQKSLASKNLTLNWAAARWRCDRQNQVPLSEPIAPKPFKSRWGGPYRVQGCEDIDTSTLTGQLVFHVFTFIVKFESERISERTKRGLSPPTSVDVVVAKRQPYLQTLVLRLYRCVIWEVAALQSWRVCSGSTQNTIKRAWLNSRKTKDVVRLPLETTIY